MHHIKKASTEGRQTMVRAILTSSGLIGILFLFEMPVFMRILFFLILALVSGVALVYAIENIRNKGSFVCKLTDEDFSQTSPHASTGNSFHIKLSEITQIEISRSSGECAQIHYFLHTDRDRFPISNNYGNPAPKFAKAIQTALPHIKTMETRD